MALKLINRNKDSKAVNKPELYEKFIEQASEAFFIFDKNLFALWMNEAAVEMSGLKNVKKTGADIKDLLPNMYNTNRFDQIKNVIRSGRPYRCRDYFFQEGQEARLFEICAFKMSSGVGLVALDITQREKKAEALKTPDQYAAGIQTVIHEPFLILNADNQVLSANRAFFDHFILKPVDVIDQVIYNLSETQWNIPALHELLELKLTTVGSAKNYEISGYFTGLGDRTLKLNAKQFNLEEEGRLITFLAIQDITEIARQRASIKKLSTIFAYSPEPIIVTDLRGDIVEMNEEAVKLYGWTRSEITQKPFSTIMSPDVRDSYPTLLDEVLVNKSVRDVETTHWSKKGEVLHMIMSIVALKDQNDVNLGTVTYMRHVPSLARAEAALQDIQKVLLQSNVPIAVTDLEGKIIDFNEAAERAFVRQRESTTGKDGSILVHPEDHDKYQAAFLTCLEGRDNKNIEIRCVTRQELVRLSELSFNMLKDARNQPYAVVIIETLKTDSERAERAYDHLLESMLEIPDPVIIENMSGEVVNMNLAATKLFGWKKVDLQGKFAKLLIPSDQQAQNEELVIQCKRGEVVRDVSSIRWSKRGNYYDVTLTMFMIFNTREEPHLLITIAKPVGIAMAPGEQSTINMDLLFEDAIDPIIIEDLSGNVIKLNKAAEALLGWKTRELFGRPMSTVIPADKRKLHEKLLLLIQNKVPIQRVASSLWSKRGKVFPVAVSLVMLKDSQGQPAAIASINQDLDLFDSGNEQEN